MRAGAAVAKAPVMSTYTLLIILLVLLLLGGGGYFWRR
jgi:hypothetical protein